MNQCSNLGLVILEQQDDFESYSGLGTDAIYGTDISGTYEQWYETRTEKRNFGSSSVLLVNLLISDELLLDNFMMPTREEFAQDKEVNEEQRVEEKSVDVVNASLEMALFSESSCLLAGGELNSWISALATLLAVP